MNRRLRERLTEAEILQVFVDVCEGVAAMHNLRPPLLHRDLKVENSLQALRPRLNCPGCYYTAPFGEHGVLVILNVQYKFPPYPVYSQYLNALIVGRRRTRMGYGIRSENDEALVN